MTQDRPMRLAPETFAGVTGNEALFSQSACWAGSLEHTASLALSRNLVTGSLGQLQVFSDTWCLVQ